jgi:hypothetical protein
MIKLLLPYKVGSPEQIPLPFLKENNIGVEANIFDAEYITAENIIKIEEEWRTLDSSYPGCIRSFHFPTEHADYLNNSSVASKLKEMIRLCHENKISKFVLHTNAITSIDMFNKDTLDADRKKYIHFFDDLLQWVQQEKLTPVLCIENMPSIGNTGEDYDSIFVLPKDFSDLISLPIGITWDICHWGFTVISTQSETGDLNFEAMWDLEKNIHHWHFGSFKHLTVHGSGIDCQEGVEPQEGLIPEIWLTEWIKRLSKTDSEQTITLEIKESDYLERQHFKNVVSWIKNSISQKE